MTILSNCWKRKNFPNCSILSISDNVIYIKDRVLKGIVEVYYMFLNDLMISRLFCQYDGSFSCVHIIYACTTLDIAKMDPGAYNESRENMGKQFMKEIFGKISKKNQHTTVKTSGETRYCYQN